jgi:hypothetical protein
MNVNGLSPVRGASAIAPASKKLVIENLHPGD